MLPGVVTEARGGCALHGMTKGQVCAVNAVENRYDMCISRDEHNWWQ